MQRYTNDILASVVVFLVALPLCMGISIASGVPPALGLITGIIGGIIVGYFAGQPLQVSGPAAGLTVLVFEIINDFGIVALGPIVLLAGALQFLAGRLKMGQWFRAMSPSVIYGMLAGIGVLIFASQFHVMLDHQPKSSGLMNLITIPEAIVTGIFPINGSPHELAAVIGLLTIIVLVAWDKLKRGRLRLIPGALVAIMTTSGLAFIFGLPIKYVNVPSNLIDAVRLSTPDTLGTLLNPAILFAAVALGFIASAETLLSAGAVDRMQNLVRTNYDKELSAQGLGNMLCGIVGALPMTGVIVRSSANVAAGARTRWSAILHGIYLLAFVSLLPDIIRQIPTSALGGILVYTGYKLVDIKNVKRLAEYGRMPVLIYFATMITIVATDLLTGVITGIVLSLLKVIYNVTHLEIRVERYGSRADVHLIGAATFVRMPKLAATLEAFAPGTEVHLHIERLTHIDHACLDLMTNWRQQHETSGGRVILEWDGLRSRYAPLGEGDPQMDPALAGR